MVPARVPQKFWPVPYLIWSVKILVKMLQMEQKTISLGQTCSRRKVPFVDNWNIDKRFLVEISIRTVLKNRIRIYQIPKNRFFHYHIMYDI